MICHLCELDVSDTQDREVWAEEWGAARSMPTCESCYKNMVSIDRPAGKMLKGQEWRPGVGANSRESQQGTAPSGWPAEYVYPPPPGGKLPPSWVWDEQGLRKT